MGLQRSFLRVLQERRYRSLGAARERESDFRLVAATNRDLSAMARAGEFRSDLLFRLRTVEVALPPLRERPEDLAMLAAHFAARCCERAGLPSKRLSPGVVEILAGYGWPGNVRELLHVMEAAVIEAGDDRALYPKHLPDMSGWGLWTGPNRKEARARARTPSRPGLPAPRRPAPRPTPVRAARARLRRLQGRPGPRLFHGAHGRLRPRRHAGQPGLGTERPQHLPLSGAGRHSHQTRPSRRSRGLIRNSRRLAYVSIGRSPRRDISRNARGITGGRFRESREGSSEGISKAHDARPVQADEWGEQPGSPSDMFWGNTRHGGIP